MANAAHSSSHDTQPQDIPIEVQGYETDPVRRGYQILWNYESTYWRALVGSDAWSLYEVLRSFCHKGNNICRPSINLLLDILSIEDRRVLTGRVKTVKGKEYRYPGSIEILQHHELITAETVGEGHSMRYIFHLDLHPGLLKEEQLSKLSKLLQKKHSELLERCEQAKTDLQSKKRPAKVAIEDKNRGMGISHTPVGNSHTPSGNFPVEQYPYNNTHITATKKKKNNNSSGDSKQDVVVALAKKGITKKVAQRLVDRYKEGRIFQKLDYLEFQEATDPDQVKSPAGYLRRAIEDDYAAPAGYTQGWQEQIQAEIEAKQAAEAQQRAIEERQRQAAEREQELELKRAEAAENLREEHNTGEAEEEIWTAITDQAKALDKLGVGYLAGSFLVSCREDKAIVAVPGKDYLAHIKQRYAILIHRMITSRKEWKTVDVEYVILDDLDDG